VPDHGVRDGEDRLRAPVVAVERDARRALEVDTASPRLAFSLMLLILPSRINTSASRIGVSEMPSMSLPQRSAMVPLSGVYGTWRMSSRLVWVGGV
jgi:hypothetical protein